MEMALTSGAASFSLSHFSKLQSRSYPSQLRSSLRLTANTKAHKRVVSMGANAKFGETRGGAALLERPGFDQSQFDPTPQAEEGGDMGRLSEKKGTGGGDSYRVLLLDHVNHTEKQVVTVLPKVVLSVTADDARKCFHESRQTGAALVIVAVKEHAEHYVQLMMRSGLRSVMEPDSNTA